MIAIHENICISNQCKITNFPYHEPLYTCNYHKVIIIVFSNMVAFVFALQTYINKTEHHGYKKMVEQIVLLSLVYQYKVRLILHYLKLSGYTSNANCHNSQHLCHQSVNSGCIITEYCVQAFNNIK